VPTYIHQLQAWPEFRWDQAAILNTLSDVRHRQGRLLGRMGSLGFERRAEALLATLTEDVLKSSEIEGEILDRPQVRSSIARRLGMDIGGAGEVDRNVEGVVEMMLDATQRYGEPLTSARLFGWHASLFPTGHSGISRITVGAWRPARVDPMQVVSGPAGRQKVHFEAPVGARLDAEMGRFLDWFNSDEPMEPVFKAALAHLWFVTIHPFEDGNGRIARAIADMALARSEDSPQRFYSLSAQIRVERKRYYEVLEATQKDDLAIDAWMAWFLDCLWRAIDGAEDILATVLTKARVWDRLAGQPLNDRQRLMINRLLDGFDGKLTSGKWSKITHTSPDTALRDITDLVERGILEKQPGGGRSTSYALAGLTDGS